MTRIERSSALMLTPAAALFGLFVLVPSLIAVYVSLLHWDGIASPTWAGLDNWTNLFSDSLTLKSMWLTLQVVVLSWLVQTPIALLLGLFMAGQQRYRGVMGALFFLPLLFSSAAVGLAWLYLLNPDFGLTAHLGLGSLSKNWLGDTGTALYAVIFVIAWQFIPFHALLYQAAARQIPKPLYEAATIDGVGTWQMFRYITLPQLRYTIVTSSLLMVTGALTYFDLIYVLTLGGPGDATRTLPLHMYLTAFQEQQIGAGSAIAVLLTVIGILVSLVLLRVSGFRRFESQQEGM